jgi:predicted enzyme related to lactoylglutathione lyase
MTEPPHGKFVWTELNTHDLDGAKRFLSATLGVDLRSDANSRRHLLDRETRRGPVGGLFDMSGDPHFKGVPEHWLSYIAVDNIDVLYKKALAAGAKEGRAPFDIPNVGRIAILAQPGGATVGWITPKPM